MSELGTIPVTSPKTTEKFLIPPSTLIVDNDHDWRKPTLPTKAQRLRQLEPEIMKVPEFPEGSYMASNEFQRSILNLASFLDPNLLGLKEIQLDYSQGPGFTHTLKFERRVRFASNASKYEKMFGEFPVDLGLELDADLRSRPALKKDLSPNFRIFPFEDMSRQENHLGRYDFEWFKPTYKYEVDIMRPDGRNGFERKPVKLRFAQLPEMKTDDVHEFFVLVDDSKPDDNLLLKFKRVRKPGGGTLLEPVSWNDPVDDEHR